MFIFKTIAELQKHLNIAGRQKKTGFIPTMGALHAGHLSLVRESKDKDCYTVCSIYVNPTQFNNAADLEKYPVSLENDMKLLADAGCDVLFTPTSYEMYGNQMEAASYDFGSLTSGYEGERRPGHFDGVITIVKRLFDAVQPDEVFFGQKDLQQCMVVNHLVNQDYSFIRFNMIPTYREENGLAGSSRNRRLSPDQKNEAARIYEALLHAKQEIRLGQAPATAIRAATELYLSSPLFKLEYFDLVNSTTMQRAESTHESGNYALVLACWYADVRLIDNVLLTD